MRLAIFAITITCLVVKIIYYARIEKHKSVMEFIMDFFRWAPKILIKNIGAEKARREYMRKNNFCSLIFWITIFAQLFLLFYSPTTE